MRETIRRLLKERNAILLAHNYQPPEIQDVADLCGDSLELSIKASQTDADVIVFCGVHFMAETAFILSPEKIVLLPNPNAGCPMADMVNPEALKKRLAELPPMPVVTYVNSPAAVKALSTVCCTSANVVRVAESMDADEMLMVPDRNLAQYAASKTDKKIHLWEGYCPFHDRLTPEDIRRARAAHPDAVFMAHPECRPEALGLADVVASTSGMIRYASESPEKSFIVGTEVGLLYPLKKANPDKEFFPASEQMLCTDMKKITLGDIVRSLEQMTGEVRVPEEIRKPALKAVERMIQMK
ncbi:quinolinate synthase NadA [Desulfonema ishimotonii]|uniref:Quinolinate synthase n=1 Tax=Desulfonema ishimotonii TaxID=45657 RepID=A0A401FV89_9BACT|nr:quinolinate synthase NadA [Desulfonema ishimotonii]GBC60880.1 quinolinate synthase NadA [Desulfonema ishimotonii]